MISSVVLTQYQHMTDGQTDRQLLSQYLALYICFVLPGDKDDV